MTALIENSREKLTEFAREFRVKDLFLFGSAAEGGPADESSDLDFLVRFQSCNPVQHAERYFGLLEALQDLFGVPIDLVEIDAVSNPYFLKEVNATRVRLHGA